VDAALILALPLISGFMFATIWRVTKYASSREEGQRLYFRAGFYAAWLLLCALLLRFSLVSYIELAATLDRLLSAAIAPLFKQNDEARLADLAVASLASLVLGPTLAYLLNIFTPKPWAFRRAIKGNELEGMFYRAATDSVPVCLTLDNRKVYVGRVVTIDFDSSERKTIAVLPVMSGYRDKDSLDLEFTTDYQKALGAATQQAEGSSLPSARAEDYVVALPIGRVVSVSFFDLQAYEHFLAQRPIPEEPLAPQPLPVNVTVTLKSETPPQVSSDALPSDSSEKEGAASVGS
jgi:hypothetical protein